jgi:uncharacterized membrane protein
MSPDKIKEQSSIAIGAALGFIVGLLTGFPIGVIWIAVGSLLGNGIYTLFIKRKK